MKIKRTLKIFFGVAAIPWLYFPIAPISSYFDRSPPSNNLHVPPEFKMAFSRQLEDTLGIYPDGDQCFIRYTSKYPPKEAVAVLLKIEKGSTHYNSGQPDINKRDAAIKSIYMPSIPHGPIGNCKIVSNSSNFGRDYFTFYIFPDGNGGTIIDFIQGYNNPYL